MSLTHVKGGMLIGGPHKGDIHVRTSAYPHDLELNPEDICYHCGGVDVKIRRFETNDHGFSFHLDTDTSVCIVWTYYTYKPHYKCSVCHHSFMLDDGQDWDVTCDECEAKSRKT